MVLAMTEDEKLKDVLKAIRCECCQRSPKTKEELLSLWFVSKQDRNVHFCSENCATRWYSINVVSQQTKIKTTKNRDGSYNHKLSFYDPAIDARITEQDHRLLKSYHISWPVGGYNIGEDDDGKQHM